MTPEEIEAIKAENAKLKADLEEANKKKEAPPPKDDEKDKGDDKEDIVDKHKKITKADLDKKSHAKALTDAVKFNYTIGQLVKENKALLPEETEGLLATIEKENFESDVDKANMTRASLIKTFFSLEENRELLTATQQASLDGYLKLTQKAKEEQAGFVYDNILEPTLGIKKKMKKAIELAKGNDGIVESSDTEKAYKDRITKLSKRYYLGEKESA